MDIFTWDDVEKSYLHAIRLHRQLRHLYWLGVQDPGTPDQDKVMAAELKEEAVWARRWAIEVALDYARVHHRSATSIIIELRARYLPEGWDAQDEDDEGDAF